MGMGLDHALLCVACFVLNMLRYCVIVFRNCVNYIHGRMYIGKDEH